MKIKLYNDVVRDSVCANANVHITLAVPSKANVHFLVGLLSQEVPI